MSVAVGTLYVAARLAIVMTSGPAISPDTPGYSDISLIGSASRPWVVPVLFAVTTDRMFVILAALVSAGAFLALAWVVASTVGDRRIATLVAVVVLAIGLAPQVTMWDAVLLTESLAVSLTLLLIVAVVRLESLPSWTLLVVFVPWVFVRDAHAYLAVMVAVLLAPVLWRRRELVVAACVALVVLWGVLAAQNNREIEAFNVTANTNFHVLPDEERTAWMVDHGMPVVPEMEIEDPFARQRALRENLEWLAWAEGDGMATYSRFLLTHPDHLFEAVPAIFADVGFQPESMLDLTYAPPTSPPRGPLSVIWPADATIYVAVLAAAATLVVLFAARAERVDRAFLVPAVLAATTVPHAFLVYHGAPIDLARHGLVLAVVLLMSLWWMTALGLDRLISEQPERVSHRDPDNHHTATRAGLDTSDETV